MHHFIIHHFIMHHFIMRYVQVQLACKVNCFLLDLIQKLYVLE